VAHIPALDASLSVVVAGATTPEYPDRVQQLDWSGLYQKSNLGASLEVIRDEWKEQFDFVLVDSRTGLSDVGGICTVQLPDVVFLFVAPNAQSLEGIKTVTRRANAERSRLSLDRPNTLYVPVAGANDRSEVDGA
jgi:hypothetical protein